MTDLKLEQTCDRCHGKGVIENPEWIPYILRHPDWPFQNSAEPEPDGAPEEPCPCCHGIGTIPTPLGHELLGLMRRHLRQELAHAG